ncbi:MAG: hypothetical protein WA941_07555 [Nitrososphaeraceae archaeon]
MSNAPSSIDLDLLRNMVLGFKKTCKQILPKVNPALIADIIERQQENPEPIYMVEVFTKSGVDSEQIRNIILEKVGVTPQVYDNGTHYVTNQKLTLEMLKEISDYEGVVAVEGDYTEAITGLGPSHSWDEVKATIGDKDYYKYQY